MSTRGGRTLEKEASQKRVLKDEQEFFQRTKRRKGTE